MARVHVNSDFDLTCGCNHTWADIHLTIRKGPNRKYIYYPEVVSLTDLEHSLDIERAIFKNDPEHSTNLFDSLTDVKQRLVKKEFCIFKIFKGEHYKDVIYISAAFLTKELVEVALKKYLKELGHSDIKTFKWKKRKFYAHAF